MPNWNRQKLTINKGNISELLKDYLHKEDDGSECKDTIKNGEVIDSYEPLNEYEAVSFAKRVWRG